MTSRALGRHAIHWAPDRLLKSQVHILVSYLPRVMHTVKISNVACIMLLNITFVYVLQVAKCSFIPTLLMSYGRKLGEAMIKDKKEVAQSVSVAGHQCGRFCVWFPSMISNPCFDFFFYAEHWWRELGKMSAASATGFSVQCVLVQITDVR